MVSDVCGSAIGQRNIGYRSPKFECENGTSRTQMSIFGDFQQCEFVLDGEIMNLGIPFIELPTNHLDDSFRVKICSI